MKRQVSTGYVFTPSTSHLDLSGVAGLTVPNLLAVINVTAGKLVYAVATPGSGYSALAGAVLTLQASLTGMSSTDSLAIIFDDGVAPAQDGSDATGVAAPTGGTGIRGWLSGIYKALTGTLAVSWTGQSVAVSNLPTTQPVSATALPLPALAATSTLQTVGNTSLATIDADIKATQPRSIASNAPSVDNTGPLSAINDAVAVVANGMNTAIVRVPTGAWTGSIVLEGTADGTTYDVALNVIPYGGGASQTTITAGGVYEVTITGLAGIRARASSAINSGPINVLVRAATGNKSMRVGAPDGNPMPVKGAPVTITPTTVVLAAGVSAQLAATNASRKLLRWMNIGTNPMTVVPGSGSAAVGAGMNYDPGLSTSNQGGGTSFDGGSTPTNAFQAISTNGTTVIVWEGN